MPRPKHVNYLRPKAPLPVERHACAAPTFCFSLKGQADPGLVPKLLGLFAKRGLVPDRFYVDHRPHEGLTIDIQIAGPDQVLAQRLASDMRVIWGVDLVLLCVKADKDAH